MRLITCFLAVLSNLALFAQDCSQTIPINVLNMNSGKFISALKKESLKAQWGKTEIPITHLSAITQSRVLVLLDVSSSMKVDDFDAPSTFVPDVFKEFRVIVNQTIREVPQGSSVSFGVFAEKSLFPSAFTSDPVVLSNNLEELKSRVKTAPLGKNTAIFDALHESLAVFKEKHIGDTILLVTDGIDTYSRIKFTDLANELKSSGIRLFVMLIDTMMGEAILDRGIDGTKWLRDMTNETGGALYVINLGSRLWKFEGGKKTMAESIREYWLHIVPNGYLLEISVPAKMKKSEKLNLSFTVPTNQNLKNAIVHFPEKLVPCPVLSATNY